MDSLLWAYLGSRRFPRELSSFLIRRFFTLSSDDRLVLRRRFRSRSRLGAALQLGFVRMTGTTLDALDYVPRSVLGHVGEQLEMSAPELTTLRALYRPPNGERQTHQKTMAFMICALSVGAVTWAPSARSADTTGEAASLEEITVTAQRREQSQQRVPISVAAVSAAELEDLNIRTAADIGELVSSAHIRDENQFLIPYLRNVGSNRIISIQKLPIHSQTPTSSFLPPVARCTRRAQRNGIYAAWPCDNPPAWRRKYPARRFAGCGRTEETRRTAPGP